MAVFSGQVQTGLIGRPLDERTYLSTNVQTADEVTYSPINYPIPSAVGGSFVDGLLASAINKFGGEVPSSVNTPFYQGVHFVQNAIVKDGSFIDLGIIVQATTTFFGCFNTQGEERTVQTVAIASAFAGVTINNLSPGSVFGAYEEIQVELGLAQSGDAVINTTFSIKFVEDPTTYFITLRGVRYGLFFTSDPNWEQGITVERRYLTSVFASSNMSETRKVLRHSPLRSMEATVIFQGQDAAGQAWARLRDAAAVSTAHPWYPDRSLTTASNTTRRVYCPTQYRRFQADGYAFLVSGTQPNSYNASEAVRIDEVFADGFSTQSDISTTYVEGTSTYPAVIGQAAMGNNTTSLMTDRIGETTITIDEVYGAAQLEIEDSTYTPTIKNSLPVMELEITFSEIPEQTILMGGGIPDSGRGRLQITKGSPYLSQTATAVCRTKEECWNLGNFFNYIKGRGKPFWVTSELDFLIFKSSAASTSFLIENSNPLADWNYLTHVKCTDSNGDYDYLEVTNRQIVGDDIQITVEASSLIDIVAVRPAHIVRMSEDVVTEEYLTDSVMICTFTVQELQEY